MGPSIETISFHQSIEVLDIDGDTLFDYQDIDSDDDGIPDDDEDTSDIGSDSDFDQIYQQINKIKNKDNIDILIVSNDFNLIYESRKLKVKNLIEQINAQLSQLIKIKKKFPKLFILEKFYKKNHLPNLLIMQKVWKNLPGKFAHSE